MAVRKEKSKIPEPSHRFFILSLTISFVLVAAVLGYSLATGYSGFREPLESKDRKVHQQDSRTSLLGRGGSIGAADFRYFAGLQTQLGHRTTSRNRERAWAGFDKVD